MTSFKSLSPTHFPMASSLFFRLTHSFSTIVTDRRRSASSPAPIGTLVLPAREILARQWRNRPQEVLFLRCRDSRRTFRNSVSGESPPVIPRNARRRESSNSRFSSALYIRPAKLNVASKNHYQRWRSVNLHGFRPLKNGRPGNSWPFVTVVGGVTNRTLHRHLLQTRTQRKLCEKSDKKMRNNSKDVLWPLQLQFYVMTEC